MKVCARTIVPGMSIKGYGRVQSRVTRNTVNPTTQAWEETVLVFTTEGGHLVRLPHELVKVVCDDEVLLHAH